MSWFRTSRPLREGAHVRCVGDRSVLSCAPIRTQDERIGRCGRCGAEESDQSQSGPAWINRLPLVRWSAGRTRQCDLPLPAMTDALFAELRRPHESYPALIPPVIAWSLMLRSRLAGLPSLPRLGGRLDALNASVLN